MNLMMICVLVQDPPLEMPPKMPPLGSAQNEVKFTFFHFFQDPQKNIKWQTIKMATKIHVHFY